MKINGLNKEQLEESRKKYGTNIIIEAKEETFFDKFKSGFNDPMIKLLLLITAIMFVMFFMGYAEIYEPVGTAIAILLVTLISARTEMASDSEYRKLKDKTKKDTCKVVREGVILTIEIDEVVVGDNILLQSGDKIPADGILIDGFLKVDNSALNGETEECKKTGVPHDFVYQKGQVTGDTFVDDHSLFRGAVIFDGTGVMEVKEVGMETMMGKMAGDMEEDAVESPLKVKLAKLAKQISVFSYIGAIVIAIALLISQIVSAGGFGAYIALGNVTILKDILDAVTLAIVIIVCAVPEGLPLMISLVLMQNTSKMLAHNVLVRKPIGIETAGSLNILYSDKTGTITKGQLEVVDLFMGSGTSIKKHEHDIINELLDLAIARNTNAMFDNNHHIIGGNATDKALLAFVGETAFGQCTQAHQIVQAQSFNSTNKFSAVQIQEVNRTFYKGAPERLLEKATTYIDHEGRVKPLDHAMINQKIDELAKRAMRVLAFGYSENVLIENEINNDTVIIGFVAIRDEVRSEARDAIKEVKAAGIQVVMITGDRKETAMAIAKDAGLLTDEDDVILTSKELNDLSDEQIKEILPQIRVIARALPTDKSRMVRLSQELNLVCGMTGDGVNDAPALKKADVGFAMGSGTEVAKENGDIVILDDNFKSIRNAILYGRTIYKNIQKFCRFQLVINVVAVGISAIAPFIGVHEPLKVTHLLWINLVMDALGSLALGNEPALEAYLVEQPRRRDESMITKSMLRQILFMGLWLLILSLIYLKADFVKSFFDNEAQWLTGYFCLFILSAVANGFNVRSQTINIFERIHENRQFVKIMGIIVVIQVALTFVGGAFFSCTPFGIKGWGLIVLMALTMIPIDMIRKIIVGQE